MKDQRFIQSLEKEGQELLRGESAMTALLARSGSHWGYGTIAQGGEEREREGGRARERESCLFGDYLPKDSGRRRRGELS